MLTCDVGRSSPIADIYLKEPTCDLHSHSIYNLVHLSFGIGDNMICPRCNSENIKFMTSLIFVAPITMMHNLTKSNMRSIDFDVWGVHWDHSQWWCGDCQNHLLFLHPEYSLTAYDSLVWIANNCEGKAQEYAQQVLDEIKKSLLKEVEEEG